MQRNPWQRSYSTPVRNRRDRTPSTISEVTRNKLERLKFRPKTPGLGTEATPREPDENNLTSEGETCAPTEKQDAARSDRAKLPATTPVSKREWRRLPESRGDIEDDGREVSPNDRLMWAAMQDEREAVYTHLSELARRKKGKKRARSSSPTSSPMGKTNSPVVNVKKLAQALKSPHPDPTLDLWDRYTLGGVGGDAVSQDGSGVGLSDLFATGSPRPAGRNVGATPQKESALRRSITSRGLNFNKRRKIEAEEDTPTNAGREGASKYSLVTSLLDSVTSSMQDPQNEESSPLFNKENPGDEQEEGRPGSPSPRKRMRGSPPSSPPCLTSSRENPTEAETADPGQATTSPPDPADEYGDDDFDDVFMAIDAQVKAAPVVSSGHPPRPPPDAVEPAERQQPRKSPRKSPRKNVHPPPQTINPAQAALAAPSDDYGIDDDDLDDDTLMELADQAAPTNSSGPAPLASGGPNLHSKNQPTAETNPTVDDDILDDDFGDDADWDAVELAATQAAVSQPSRSQHAPTPSNVPGSIPVCHHGRPEGPVYKIY